MDEKFNYTCNFCNREFTRVKEIKTKTFFCCFNCFLENKKQKGHTQIFCGTCGKEFLLLTSKIKEKNFCCKKCYIDELARIATTERTLERTEYKCSQCQKSIFILPCARKGKKDIFCSKQCRYNYDKEHFSGSGNPNFKGGDITVECKNCGIIFQVLRSRSKRVKFCSQKCLGIYSMKNHSNSMTNPEIIIMNFLIKNDIEFISQNPMYDKFIVDFYLPKENIVIEALGDYWHGNPLIFSDEKITDRQKKARIKDFDRRKFLEEKGHNVFYFWEKDLKKNSEELLKILLNI